MCSHYEGIKHGKITDSTTETLLIQILILTFTDLNISLILCYIKQMLVRIQEDHPQHYLRSSGAAHVDLAVLLRSVRSRHTVHVGLLSKGS